MKRSALFSIVILPVALALLPALLPLPTPPDRVNYTNWINRNRGCVPAECGPNGGGTWAPFKPGTSQTQWVITKQQNGALVGNAWSGTNQSGFFGGAFDVCAANWTAYNTGIKKWCPGYPKPSTTTPKQPTVTTPPPVTPPPTTVLPPPKIDTPRVVIQAFEAAQQGSDQTIRVPRTSTLTCNGGKVAPCNVTSGKQYKVITYWTEGPFITSSTLNSFTLTAPAGFTIGDAYDWVKKPGADVFTRYQDAVLRFYKTTPTGEPYTYSAKLTVTYEMREYKWDGSKKTLVGTSKNSITTAVRCAPSSCSFPVQGANG